MHFILIHSFLLFDGISTLPLTLLPSRFLLECGGIPSSTSNYHLSMNFGNHKKERKRRKLGLSRHLELPRDVPPHPSKGGSRGYPVEFRISEMELFDSGLCTTTHKSSICCWKKQLLPHLKTGNVDTSTIIGFDFSLPSIHLCISRGRQWQSCSISIQLCRPIVY